jgi:DNA replication and repair protein RecF
MYLQHLSLIHFKNYSSLEIDFCSQINCLVGNNGEGKTTVLDAIHYLSNCKSFFNPIDSQNIKHQEDFLMIKGVFENNEQSEEIYIGLKRNQKKIFKRNQKEYERLADHIGLVPLVMISPADAELIAGGSEYRRKFLDSIISQFNKQYLHDLIQYNKILSHRNALLKQAAISKSYSSDSFEIWDMQLIDLAEKIARIRKDFLDQFIPLFTKFYAQISDNKEQVHLHYNTQLLQSPMQELLKDNLKRDLALEYTSVGIHKDDLDFLMNNTSLKKFASQGQQKSFLIALKLAHFQFLKTQKQTQPILLLDDIYDKLDDTRVTKLMDIVSHEGFGQLFITDTHPTRLQDLFTQKKYPFKFYSVSSGNIN